MHYYQPVALSLSLSLDRKKAVFSVVLLSIVEFIREKRVLIWTLLYSFECMYFKCFPVLDMTHAPKLSKTEGSPRSVNLSFFVPAFSLFAMASQYLPQMFPSFTTTTTSRRQQRQERSVPSASAADSNNNNNLNWVEEFIRNGIVY